MDHFLIRKLHLESKNNMYRTKIQNGQNYLPPVSFIPVVHIDLQISPRIFEKIRNDPDFIFSGLGGRWFMKKNLKQKISWHCPFNPPRAHGAGVRAKVPAAGVHHAYYSAEIIMGRKLGILHTSPSPRTMKYEIINWPAPPPPPPIISLPCFCYCSANLKYKDGCSCCANILLFAIL